MTIVDTAEQKRLNDAREARIPWKKRGPYLSELQWGTVREDYSEGGNAWNYFMHDQSRARAYKWGENGLTNSEANHGEDVKEYYFGRDVNVFISNRSIP